LSPAPSRSCDGTNRSDHRHRPSVSAFRGSNFRKSQRGGYLPNQVDVSTIFTYATVRADDGAITLQCRGPLTLEYALPFKTEAKRLVGAYPRIVLDLTAVTRMDSSGLGAIVSLYVSARSKSCQIEVINLSPCVRELLRNLQPAIGFRDLRSRRHSIFLKQTTRGRAPNRGRCHGRTCYASPSFPQLSLASR
jgi:anti-anti-sigma factor